MSDIPFDANVTMKQPLLIATEHLPTCKGCIQRGCNHALGNEEVETNEEILQAAKFASDASSLMTEIMDKVNSLIGRLNDMVTDAMKASIELDKTRKEQTALKAGVRVLTKGQRIATAVTAVVVSIISLIILL